MGNTLKLALLTLKLTLLAAVMASSTNAQIINPQPPATAGKLELTHLFGGPPVTEWLPDGGIVGFKLRGTDFLDIADPSMIRISDFDLLATEVDTSSCAIVNFGCFFSGSGPSDLPVIGPSFSVLDGDARILSSTLIEGDLIIPAIPLRLVAQFQADSSTATSEPYWIVPEPTAAATLCWLHLGLLSIRRLLNG